ncbi:MAG: RNA polymerase sporulation sigma factor SigE [Clostridia bacterium]|nr:RNA polymerase sporulation sigma factor SigE [Clostridia bacterium]
MKGRRHMLFRIKEKLKEIFSLFKRKDGEVYYINGSDNLPPPLSKEKEDEILSEMEKGERRNTELLIIHNLRLVVYIARKFENTGICVEDLISIGTIGLIKAVNSFCPSRKIKLATYASRCIENEILMYMRKTANRKNELSFDEPLNVDWDGNELLLGDILGSDNDVVNRNIEYLDEKRQLLRVVGNLEEREKQIMTMRFGLFGSKEYTQKQVADMLGISQSYISRLEKRILEKLKKELMKME